MCKLTFETPRRLEGRHGTFLQQFDEMTAIHDRIADNEMAFSMALHQMHEDLMELSMNMDRQRKQLKMSGLSSEKKVHDSIQMLEKVKPQVCCQFSAGSNIFICSPRLDMIRLARNMSELGLTTSMEGTLKLGVDSPKPVLRLRKTCVVE